MALLLVDDEITQEEAEDFIEELIHNQILVSEIEPTVTGEDFLTQLEGYLVQLNVKDSLLKEIQYYSKFLKEIDQQLGNTPEKYLKLSERLKQLETPFELKYLFQTDLYTQTQSNQLNVQWGYKVKRALAVLNKISITGNQSNLKRYQQ